MNKLKFETPDMTQKNIDKISQMFPNCITETKDENGNLKKAVNFELLQQMLSDEIADKDEAYEFYNAYANDMEVYIKDNEYGMTFSHGDWN